MDDRVADQLTGPVIRHVAAPLDLVNLEAVLAEELGASRDVGALRTAAQSDDPVMLQEDERVVRQAALDARAGELALQRKRLTVIGEARQLDQSTNSLGDQLDLSDVDGASQRR
jgi:hypothetical protein